MTVITLVCWIAWLIVLFYLDPEQTGLMGFLFFYVSLFFALIGTFSLLGFFARVWFSKEQVIFRHLGIATRQSLWFSMLLVGTLLLQGSGFIRWWNVLLLIIFLNSFSYPGKWYGANYMKQALQQLKQEALDRLSGIDSADALRDFEIEYLGRKGKLTNLLRQVKDLSAEEKTVIGKLANEIKQEVVEVIENTKSRIATSEKVSTSVLEMTWPGRKKELGHLHPITQFMRKVQGIFISMGFEVIEGTEVETAEYNFDLLNIPKNHPARDAWDTFYIEGGLLLRTHTSPVQLRSMKNRKPGEKNKI